MTITRAFQGTVTPPQAIRRETRHSYVRGAAALVYALGVLLAGAAMHAGSSSLWGYTALVVALLAVPTALASMSVRTDYTRLDADGQPIEHLINFPGAVWARAGLDGREVSQQELSPVAMTADGKIVPVVREEGFNYTHYTVWRSLRRALGNASLTMTTAALVVLLVIKYDAIMLLV